MLNDEGNLLWYKNIEEKKSGAEAQGQLAVNQIIRVCVQYVTDLMR